MQNPQAYWGFFFCQNFVKKLQSPTVFVLVFYICKNAKINIWNYTTPFQS